MYRLDNVGKQYRQKGRVVHALRPTSLEIAAGEFVAVVGSSGSGKTTLLSMLGGMLAPTEGEVWLEGEPLYAGSVSRRADVRRRKVGFVFQTFNLVPYLSALENVQVPLMLSGRTTADQRTRAQEALHRVGLESRQHHKPCELSTGQQQRVAVARTLANDPSVVLADEPTGNLDPETRQHILGFLEEFHREGRTVVLVTHDPLVAARAQRTLTLSHGSVCGDARPPVLKSA